MLSRSGDNAIRLVPVYESVASRLSYEHRVFDVKPSSIYALLGIQNSDIIVAADGYLIKEPRRFIEYIQLLPRENEASIEIRRAGEPRLLKYSFIPAVKP
jgi:type II secretory pathway component PulC